MATEKPAHTGGKEPGGARAGGLSPPAELRLLSTPAACLGPEDLPGASPPLPPAPFTLKEMRLL